MKRLRFLILFEMTFVFKSFFVGVKSHLLSIATGREKGVGKNQ